MEMTSIKSACFSWLRAAGAALWLAGAAAGAANSASPAEADTLRPGAGGAANLAMVGEPQTLDPMGSTADLVGTIMQHVYEPLYTFDARWQIAPMLAEALPSVSDDGTRVTIPLRHGVKFHNGKEMDADDVIASLRRWIAMTPRGKSTGAEIVAIASPAPFTVELTLRQPYAPLLAQLALPTGFAAIMPKEAIALPLKQFIGTGPYRFGARKSDRYVLLTRFDGYSARSEAPSGYAGRRQAYLQQLRFIPVPNANTRVLGALSGQYQFADLLPVEAYPRLKRQPDVRPVITAPFGFPYVVLNTRQGPLAGAAMRRAMAAALNMHDILAAGFGDPAFFVAEGNHFPKGTAFYSDAHLADYSQANPVQARALAAAAGYHGEVLKFMTSKQYEFHYRMALVIADQLKQAGFAVELQVVEWATLIARRNDTALWDLYLTHSAFLPEPMLSPPQLGDGAPGGWNTPAKQAVITRFVRQADPVLRGAQWAQVQALLYTEVPYIKLGNFNSLTATGAALEHYVAAPWPFFWNTRLAPPAR